MPERIYDRRVFGGLATDLPPTDMGNSALDLKNVVPQSAKHIRSRHGTSKKVNFAPSVLGRNVIVSALPGDLGNAVMISLVNVTGEEGSLTYTTEGAYRFKPSQVGATHAALASIAAENIIYLILPGDPLKVTPYNYSTGVAGTAFGTIPSDEDYQTVIDVSVMGPVRVADTTNYDDGIVAATFEYNDKVLGTSIEP